MPVVARQDGHGGTKLLIQQEAESGLECHRLVNVVHQVAARG
jgi:hypothetical protein